MQRRNFLRLLAATPALARAQAPADELVIAVNQTTIEAAALLIQKIPGVTVKRMPSGRAASAQLVAGTADAASGNETQALVSSMTRPELRVVLTLAECRYRLVARRSAGIRRIADLRGKRIAYTPNTSSQYFLLDVLRSGGVRMEEITPALLEPTDMPPAMLDARIDAMAMWEPQPQIAIDKLGPDAIVLTNPNEDRYFERFGLNTTTAVLQNPKRRTVMVGALRAIHEMSEKLAADPAPYYGAIAEAVGVPVAVVEKVWPQFTFPAALATNDLLSTFVAMEPWAAATNKRAPRDGASLARVLDGSVARDAGI